MGAKIILMKSDLVSCAWILFLFWLFLAVFGLPFLVKRSLLLPLFTFMSWRSLHNFWNLIKVNYRELVHTLFRKFRLSYFNVCWLYLPNIMLLKMCFVLKISRCLVAFIEFVRLNFTYPFESHTPERDIWIDEPLMPFSHTITRKPGGDYDWLIVQICT